MNSAYQISNLDPCNQPRPNDAGRFAAEIERLGRESHLTLRLTWQPDVMATLWGQKRRRYGLEKYGYCEHLRGWWIGHMEEVKGQLMFAPRQKVRADKYDVDPHAAFQLPNGDWVQADLDENLIAEPRWIVEYKLHDREKEFHEAERYEWESPFVRHDALGPYPEDGKWARLFVIAQHWVKCCEEANARHELCQGIGRAPNEYDLQDIRKILQEREAEAALPEPGTPQWEHQMAEETRKIENEIAEGKARNVRTYDEIFERAIMPVLKRVYRRNNPDKAPTVGIHIPEGHPLLKGNE